MMGVFQPWHLIVVLVIVVMIFGPGKLPELGKAVGDGFRELKRSTSEEPTVPAPAALQPSPISSIACPTCQAAVPNQSRFCGTCGSAMSSLRVA
jgi:TatA/E family protein of Tat protein translocase